MDRIRRFIISLVSFSIVIAAGDLAWIRYMPSEKHFPHPWIILGFFILATLLIHFVIVKAAAKNTSAIIRVFMLSTVIKLFTYILIIVVYMLNDPAHGKLFAIGFLAHYFLFSGFELTSIIRQFKR